MPRPRTILWLLWAGPAYTVCRYAVGVALAPLSPSGAPPFELLHQNPVLFTALMLPPALLLVTAGFGIWFALRSLAGRSTPIGAIRHMPFHEMRLRSDEILPIAAGLTVALPALSYLIPMLSTIPTANQFHLVQVPGIFSGWIIAWAVWRMPVSRVMKTYQVLTPILILLGVLLRGIGAGNGYGALLARFMGYAYLAWLCVTPIWLAALIRQRTPRTGPPVESRI